MEAEVGREGMGRLLCWSVNGPYLLYLAATPFFFNGWEGAPRGSHRLDWNGISFTYDQLRLREE